MQPVMIYITTPNREEAISLAQRALEARLAACANVLERMHSLYWWQGKIEESEETALLLKTHHRHTQALTQLIRQHHSYDCPAILVIPISDGNPDYLSWIAAETTIMPD